VTDYPWYDEIPPDEPLLQGDLIESCPVLAYDPMPEVAVNQDLPNLLEALEAAAGVQTVRVIVMTQACDLAERHVRHVILCPIYHLETYRQLWEEFLRHRNQGITARGWERHIKDIKDGKVWNLTMLDKRDAENEGDLAIPHQVIDFHEVFSLPLDFLDTWVRTTGLRRLRLRPPYREHVSQAFARFFMRVGLPQDIKLS
jgi:hypothetical protein